MSYIIDRRLNAKKKSTVNRQRFLRRYRKHIKRAVEEAVNQRSIKDIEQGGQVTIPSRDISEPIFHHGDGGQRQRIYPGNKEYMEGDEFRRPQGGGGGGSGKGKASNQGDGMDVFTFNINQEEFLDFLFEGLELPYMVKKKLRDTTQTETRRAGFTTSGSPEKLHIVRSLRAAHARRIALSGKERRQVRELKKELWALEDLPTDPENTKRRELLRAEIEALEKKIRKLPFIDDFDLKFTNLVRVPVPSSKAVMFCVMDVSGSMTQAIKDMAKRFFILLYLFLNRNYKQIEVVFIRHHTHAKEVDEEEFFYSRETGGTIVSSALTLSGDVIRDRYPAGDWNIYVAQASDGDNWDGDSDACRQILVNRVLPHVQYYAYVEITTGPHQNLWLEYERVREAYPDTFAMHQIEEASDIYPVFRKLFARKMEGAA
jgi:uncharacterized sporulation protein YeaH/YhbH (DUF444 family)